MEPREQGPRPRPKSTPDEIDRMVELYESGLSMPVIGRRLGRHHTTVLYHLRKRGVEIRSHLAAGREH